MPILLQAGSFAPSAPPMPSAPAVPPRGDLPPTPGAPPPRSDAEFWGRALNTPIDSGVVGGGGRGSHVNYPAVYQPSGPAAAHATHAPFDKSSLATAPVRSKLYLEPSCLNVQK